MLQLLKEIKLQEVEVVERMKARICVSCESGCVKAGIMVIYIHIQNTCKTTTLDV